MDSQGLFADTSEILLSLLCFTCRLVILLFYVFIVYLYPSATHCAHSIKKNEYPFFTVQFFSFPIRYDTRCYLNVRWKADMCQLNLPRGNDNRKTIK